MSLVLASPFSLGVNSMIVPGSGGKAFAEKMPGVTGPFGFFDPLGLTPDSEAELLQYREAELTHGRVAMVGALGYLVQSHFTPMFDVANEPVIRHLDIVLQSSLGQGAGATLLGAIMFSELHRARTGWTDPDDFVPGAGRLQQGYEPGTLGFDPLGMKPKGAAELLAMQNKELNNGRACPARALAKAYAAFPPRAHRTPPTPLLPVLTPVFSRRSCDARHRRHDRTGARHRHAGFLNLQEDNLQLADERVYGPPC